MKKNCILELHKFSLLLGYIPIHFINTWWTDFYNFPIVTAITFIHMNVHNFVVFNHEKKKQII